MLSRHDFESAFPRDLALILSARTMVSRPRYTEEDFDGVARGVAAGKHQKTVAAELGWSLGSVKHCLGRMRAILAAAGGQDWLDPHLKTSVQVSREWLEKRAREGAL